MDLSSWQFDGSFSMCRIVDGIHSAMLALAANKPLVFKGKRKRKHAIRIIRFSDNYETSSQLLIDSEPEKLLELLLTQPPPQAVVFDGFLKNDTLVYPTARYSPIADEFFAVDAQQISFFKVLSMMASIESLVSDFCISLV